MTSQPPFMAYRSPYGIFRKTDAETLLLMRESGIRTICISPMNTVSGAGTPYCDAPILWKHDHTYDFSTIDILIQEIRTVIPDARFLCGIDLNSPIWLARKIGMDSFSSLAACAMHPEWNRLTFDWLRAVLAYLDSHYADCLDACFFACGRTMEWFDLNSAGAELTKTAAYPEWCRRNNLPLRPVPRADEIYPENPPAVERDPGESAHTLQWLRYVNEIPADLAIRFLRTGRECLRPECRLGLFFGNNFNLIAEGSADAERVFRDGKPDFVIAAACNANFQIGMAGGNICSDLSLRRHGIRFLHECDRITSTSNHVLSNGVTLSGGIWNGWRDAREDIAGLKRETAMCIVRKYDIWWFNIWGKSYDAPEVRSYFPRLHAVWTRYASQSTGSAAEILLVVDPESNLRTIPRNGAAYPSWQNALAYGLRTELAASGLAFDIGTFDDLTFADLSQYRMIIFQNSAFLTPERERVLRSRVLCRNRLAVWFHRPGLNDADMRLAPENVKRLTGLPAGISSRTPVDCGGYRSVCFADNPADLDHVLLRKLAADAGVHLFCSPGYAVWNSAEFLMVHAKDAGICHVTLPKTALRVTEVFENVTVASDSKAFDTIFEGPDTKLFRLEFRE